MKNVSLVLNVVLLVAVGVLFYFHFKGSGQAPVVFNVPSRMDTSVLSRPLKVAYVDLDTIEEKFVYFKQTQDEFNRRREQADRTLNQEYNDLERRRYEMAQRGATLSQKEVEDFQKDYTTKMQELQKDRDAKSQQFLDEQQKLTDDVWGKIKTFLSDYNKSKKYSFIFTSGKGALNLFYEDTAYNITSEVLAGLNATVKVTPGQ
jgi:outer membrane protein